MRSELRLSWQKIKQHPFIAVGLGVALIAMITFVFAVDVLGWDWTGFRSGESKITITTTSKGVTTAKELQTGKTLWDWLGLLGLLAIPVMVGFGGAWFTHKQQVHDQYLAEQRTKSERELADKRAEYEQVMHQDHLREELLQKYFDDMSELLLKDGLLDSEPLSVKPTIARARTLAVLRRLSQRRKGLVLQFLYESKLIDKEKRIVDLRGADLNGADLHGADLHGADLHGTNWSLGVNFQHGTDLNGANLSEADLSQVDLSQANLVGVNLSGANLAEVNLTGADLSGANLRDAKNITAEELEKQAKSLQGAIMPTGPKQL